MVVIVNAFRTAIGKMNGAIQGISPEELVSTVMNNNLSQAGLSPNLVDEVVVGQTKQSSHAPNIARVALLKAGFPVEVPGYTVHRQCGSGMQAVHNAYMAIQLGTSEIVLAGGVEVMSQSPYYTVMKRGEKLNGNFMMYDSNTESQPRSQPAERFGVFSMGESAEYLAEKYGISREEQDEFALNSQEKALRSTLASKFLDEIIPLQIFGANHVPQLFSADENPRHTSMQQLSQLKPAFVKQGTVTAGNSSSRNDGAAMVLLMKEERALQLGLTPLARIVAIGSAGVEPREMGLGPVPATNRALKQAGLSLKDMDLIELNEAFAAQSLAVLKEWGSQGDNVNVNGGAIALGHPLGSSGARIIVTLAHEMQKRDLRYGLASLCVAGGQGISTILEKWDGQR